MQKEKVYIMDASAVSKICNGTFYDNEVLMRVSYLIITAIAAFKITRVLYITSCSFLLV